MQIRSRLWKAAGAGLIALTLTVAAPASGPQDRDTPTMTNSSIEAPPEPLPAGWPAGARDVQLRGSACESGYGKADARAAAAPGDALLPILGTATGGFDAAYVGVRPVPFLTRRDVVQATIAANADPRATYSVRLELTEDGAARVRDYTASNLGRCVALVASGKVLWAASITEAVESDVYVLDGAFSAATALAIVDLFWEK